ncbi:MAG: matrixin family metalloprotease [bacterium]|nr:matrixin family metalloprotease [bacterium]
MKRVLVIIFIGVAIGAAVFLSRGELENLFVRLEGQFFPCAKPITYTVGSFDSRFDISENAFLAAIAKAEKIWEDPIGKNLFAYAPDGNLKVNLVYDFRQEATEKLRTLGIIVGNDEASYNELKSKYDVMQADYLEQKSAYDARVAAFLKRNNAYETTVAYWNKRGGASRETYDQLNAEKASLSAEGRIISALMASLNAEASNINAIVVALNHLVAQLNLNVDRLNEIGQERGAEFQEGIYKSDANGAEIDIYQFDTDARLVRVLAHELGHALGLPHVSDPKAIMYRLNENTNESLTAADFAEIKALCGF